MRRDAVDQPGAPRRVCEVGPDAEEAPAERLDAAARLPVVAGERDAGDVRARLGIRRVPTEVTVNVRKTPTAGGK